MKYSAFGRTGDQVARLGFGAMGLGGPFGYQEEATVIRSILNGLDQGINFIDTARVYKNSELILGRALKQWSGNRPFIATKAASASKLGWGSAVDIESA